jgi:hypothetical protein
MRSTHTDITRNHFIVGFITPALTNASDRGTSVFFADFCFLSGIWTLFFVKETNNLALEQMDTLFGDAANAVEEEERKKRILRELLRELGSIEVPSLMVVA